MPAYTDVEVAFRQMFEKALTKDGLIELLSCHWMLEEFKTVFENEVIPQFKSAFKNDSYTTLGVFYRLDKTILFVDFDKRPFYYKCQFKFSIKEGAGKDVKVKMNIKGEVELHIENK